MKANKIFIGILAITCIVFTGCDDKRDPIIEELDFDRVLGPANLTARIRNLTTIELNWNLRDGADHYVVEFSEDSLEFGTIIFADEVTADELPYQHTFAGETRYSARVKAVSSEELDDSKWATITIETAQENIFLPIPGENVQDIYAILLWQAGSEVTHFLISPGDIERPITDDEKADGEATLEDLEGSTDYTVTLYNGTKRRGVVTFSTLEAADIYPGDDLLAAITNAAEGEEITIAPGEYTTGAIAMTKSITLKGQKSYDRPVINGQITCGTTVASIAVEDIIFDGNGGTLFNTFFNTVAGCNLASLVVDGCDLRDFRDGIISNNASGVYGSVTIKNTYAHSMSGSGGDGLDFRGGSISSLTVENSTFANAFRSFLRMQVPCTMVFKNCTFYKISMLDNSNNSGIFRASGAAGPTNTLDVRNCLFAETGVLAPTNVQSGNFCRNAGNMLAVPTYANNNIHSCYNLMVGLYTAPAQVSATELNPGFVDAANGDFTVTNQTIIDNNIGDPRWFQ